MKKLLFIFAVVLSLIAYSINTYADGAVKIYKNGTYITLYANDIDSLVFVTYNDNDADYIQINLDGKTYRDEILFPIYGQIEPIGRDKDNKPMTYTYDMIDHFGKEEEGFWFSIGVVHYSKRADLLASSPGTYSCIGHVVFDVEDGNYKNFTLQPNLEIDYNKYDWKSGTHEVTSIKEVDGNIQLEGSFTSSFEYKGDNRTVMGNYRITIP